VSSSAVAPPGTAIPAAPTPVQLTELAPTQGDLTPLLVAQSARARAKGLITLVEFYADWCPPCRAFQKSLDDAAMKDALQGVYLIKLNLDDWHDKLDGTGYVTHTIPSFFRVGADGRPVGKMLDGDKWRRPTPAAMAASIKSFLAAPE
jgi:thiol-disulfide isomerase/thioredoxin